MREQKNSKGGLWSYLEALGILENGSDEEIKRAKKAYRKIYFTKHKRIQRASQKEFTLRFSKENEEFAKLDFLAKQHKMKTIKFIKSAVMAYINQTYIVPDRLQIATLEQLLSQCLNEIQRIVKQKERFRYEREQKYEIIEGKIAQLENEMHRVLKCPYTIEELVIKAIEEKPRLKQDLLSILRVQKDDHQNQIT